MLRLSKKQTLGAFAVLLALVAAVGWYLFSSLRSPVAKKGPRVIGILQLTGAIDAYVDGVKKGLEDFGYVEGRDVKYLYENVDENIARAPAVVQRYIDEDVDLLYVITNPSLAAALEVTRSNSRQDLPIVFVGVDKPVETGLVAGMSSSGNNATGIAGAITDNVAKQLSLLREVSPKAKKIGVFGEGFYIKQGIGGLQFKALREEAPKYGFEIVEYTTEVPPDADRLASEFERIAAGIKPGDIDAILHIAGHFHPTQQFLEIALAERLKNVVTVEPTIEEVKDGGIIGYAPNLFAVGRDAAVLIDKIFRGAKPHDVPVEVPLRNELWVNLDAADRAGVTIPDSVLTKASNRIGQ